VQKIIEISSGLLKLFKIMLVTFFETRCITSQAAYCSCSGALRHRVGVQCRPQPKPALTHFGLQPFSHT